MAKNNTPKRAQVTVKWACCIAFGSPPEVIYLIPAQTRKIRSAINPRPTTTEITFPKTCSISAKPAGHGPELGGGVLSADLLFGSWQAYTGTVSRKQ